MCAVGAKKHLRAVRHDRAHVVWLRAAGRRFVKDPQGREGVGGRGLLATRGLSTFVMPAPTWLTSCSVICTSL